MKQTLVASFAIGLFAVSGFAQVNQRKQDQQDRVAQGVQSGSLTAGETSRIENRERGINGEVRADRAADGGKLTGAERSQINRQQNGVSRQIYNDKHNANNAKYGNGVVGQRRQSQQDRIAQGIRSDKLNAGQTAHLENREAAVNHEVAADRRANGGKLTGAEHQQVNRQQNNLSRSIYNKKH